MLTRDEARRIAAYVAKLPWAPETTGGPLWPGAGRVALADCEALFRVREPNKRMKDKAAHACHALCRARVAEQLQRSRGTRIGEYLKLVLSIIDRQER